MKYKDIDKYSSGKIEKSILLGKKYRPSQTVENEYTERCLFPSPL